MHFDLELIKEIWSYVWPVLALSISIALGFYTYKRNKKFDARRTYAEKIHDTLVPLHEIIGVFYAQGETYIDILEFEEALRLASNEKLNALKLGKARYNNWNQAISSANQWRSHFRRYSSGDPLNRLAAEYRTEEELVGDMDSFMNSTLAAQAAIERSLQDMRKILGVK